MDIPLGNRVAAGGKANAGGAGPARIFARRTLVAGGASVAARDEAHASRTRAGTAVIADWGCGFSGRLFRKDRHPPWSNGPAQPVPKD
jgi:hypothetical protein